jgi:hypothetical protein
MTEATDPTWRQNVQYEGCFADFPLRHPELQDEQYYNWKHGGESTTIVVDPPLTDRQLPNRRKTEFSAFIDGPARVMPSIDFLKKEEYDHVAALPVGQAVQRCYEKALVEGKEFFGLQHDGVCMASSDRKVLQAEKLPRRDCKMQQASSDKKGGVFTNSVYRIKDPEFQLKGKKKRANRKKEENRLTYAAPRVGTHMSCDDRAFFKLSPSQLFQQEYFKPSNPIKGELLFESAGSGKTCAALNAVGNFFEPPSQAQIDRRNDEAVDPGDERWRVYWVTRKTLTSTPFEELYRNICLTKLRDIIEDDERPIVRANGEVVARTRAEKIEAIRSGRVNQLLSNRFGIQLLKKRILSYDDFVRLVTRDAPTTNPAQRSNRRFRELHDEQVRHGDFGYKTLFVFDEAHNLRSPALPAEEREYLDAHFREPVRISGKTFRNKADVYGSAVGEAGPLEGRDAVAAMLYRSYHLSQDRSAKALLLSATPGNMFWLLNLLLPDPADRLPLDMLQYADPFTLKLNEELVQRFQRAAYGRLSYLDTTHNPETFPRKVFTHVHRSTLHPFHAKIIRDRVATMKKQGASQAAVVAAFRDLSLCAQTSGKVYSNEQVRAYQRQLREAEQWDEKVERKRMQLFFEDNIERARTVFGFSVSPEDVREYDRKQQAFEAWSRAVVDYNWRASQANQPEPRLPPAPPAEILDIMTPTQELIPFDRWEYNTSSVAGPSVVSGEIQQEYEKKLQLYYLYQKKLQQFNDRPVESPGAPRPRRPAVLRDFLDEYGVPVTQAEYLARRLHVIRAAENDQLRRRYDRLVVAYNKFHRQVQRQQGQDPGEEPVPSPEALEVLREDGTRRTLEEWYVLNRYPQKFVNPKATFTAEQQELLPLLIRDPSTQRMRLRTVQEFVRVEQPDPKFKGEPEDGSVSFLVWHPRRFQPGRVRELLPYYAPMLASLVQNIVQIEKEMRQRFGHGTKHVVFTFSTSGRGAERRNYGSRIVLAAFAAHPELFELLVEYQPTSHTARRLVTENKRQDRWGVGTLSSGTIKSENIPGNTRSRPGVVDYSVGMIQAATQQAFNDPGNVHGERIKVLVLDGAFAEGVGAHDVGAMHFLNPGVSKSELVQASARSARNCKSRHLPFYRGVGALLRLHFYELYDPGTQQTVYDQLVDTLSYEQKLRSNLTDTFTKLAAEVSVNHRLNEALHEYDPVFRGVVVGLDRRSRNAYLVEMSLEHQADTEQQVVVSQANLDRAEAELASSPTEPNRAFVQQRTREHEQALQAQQAGERAVAVRSTGVFVVPPSYLVSVWNSSSKRPRPKRGWTWHKGDPVRNTRRAPGMQDGLVQEVTSSTTCLVNYDGTVESARIQDLRLQSGTPVSFRMPDGVDVATQVLNIGDARGFQPDTKALEFVRDVQLPEQALKAVGTVFTADNSAKFMLLGLLNLVVTLQQSGDFGRNFPLTVVLPNQALYNETPTVETFAGHWRFQEDGERRQLRLDRKLLARFLKLEAGISMMLLVLTGKQEADRVNVLVYSPAFGTVERFDPKGRTFHQFDSVQLDAELHDLFAAQRKPLRYMSLAETAPLDGIQHLQELERKNRGSSPELRDPGNFSTAFTLLYMTARIMYTAKHRQHPESMVFPAQFQRGLAEAVTAQFGGNLSGFIQAYSRSIASVQKQVRKSKQWDPSLPFWSNVVAQIRQRLEQIRIGTKPASGRRSIVQQKLQDIMNYFFPA